MNNGQITWNIHHCQVPAVPCHRKPTEGRDQQDIILVHKCPSRTEQAPLFFFIIRKRKPHNIQYAVLPSFYFVQIITLFCNFYNLSPVILMRFHRIGCVSGCFDRLIMAQAVAVLSIWLSEIPHNGYYAVLPSFFNAALHL